MGVTATSLLDLLVKDLKPGTASATGSIVPFAEKVITVCIGELEDLREYERQLDLAAVTDPQLELELRRTIWELYKEWAARAEDIRARGRLLQQIGVPLAGVDRLFDQIGRVQARLAVKPEQIVKARQQARDGQIVPAKELRDELNARLRG